MQTLKLFNKLYCCIVESVQKSCCDIKNLKGCLTNELYRCLSMCVSDLQ